MYECMNTSWHSKFAVWLNIFPNWIQTHNVWMYEHFLIGSPLPFHRRDINANLTTSFLFSGLLERPMAWKQLNSFGKQLNSFGGDSRVQPFNESIEKLFNFYALVNPLPQSEISRELYALRYGGFPPTPRFLVISMWKTSFSQQY